MADGGLAALSLPRLREQLQEERHANALLQTEVEMLEKWCRKMELCGPSLPPPAEELMQARGRSKSTLHRRRGQAVEQKHELAEQELTEGKDEIQRMKEGSGQTLQNLEAVIEEADIWETDVKKAIRDFEKDISTISSKRWRDPAPESLLGYMEEKNCQRDLLREKLCSKNCLLRGYKKKLQQQLLQKEQLGETIREVHLQQLQVRNALHQEEMAEKNQELMQLKVTSGKIVQVFNFYKRRLQDTMETSTSLVKNISRRKELLEKIEREAALVEEQRAKAESVNQQLQLQLSDYRVPSVLTYVQKKVAVIELEKSLKAWERKVAVAQMSLQSCRRAWNQIKMSGNQH